MPEAVGWGNLIMIAVPVAMKKLKTSPNILTNVLLNTGTCHWLQEQEVSIGNRADRDSASFLPQLEPTTLSRDQDSASLIHTTPNLALFAEHDSFLGESSDLERQSRYILRLRHRRLSSNWTTRT